MTNMKLSQILENVKVKNEYIDVEITDVTADSRKVEKGSLFVCIKGASFDGHSVAEKMLEKGAACVVCERDLGLDRQVIVEDTRKAFSPICASFYANPTKQLKLIGLTGTNGKTTTTFLIKQILENTGKKVGLIKIRVFRPFPEKEIAKALANVKAVAIMDRSEMFAATSGPLGAEVRAAMHQAHCEAETVNYFYGLGGRDITVNDFKTVYDNLETMAKTHVVTGMYDYIGLREEQSEEV